ncbi:hypothetical protein QBC45DRAFT_467238 [Copromyces sp. CBS 386.78]|nr:hypothetical protein QBC45DRAFT_467238 [Copromyces sp. CBS 386.78]
MPPVDTSRKRPGDGGPEDARPHKRRSQGAPVASSNPAFAEESDTPALISLADGSRRYNEFKGDIGDGICRTLSGGGALFPTNYKLDLPYQPAWICPLYTCRLRFDQCSSLGLHFSKAHRGLKLYDEAERSFFHVIGKRTKPDAEGRLRPIVVARGFGAPGRELKQQAPAAPTANRPATATATPTSTASRAANSSALAPITPAQAARPSSHKIIEINSDDEDVKPAVENTPVRSSAPRVPAQQEQTRRKIGNNGIASRVRHAATFEAYNSQELGAAHHHRTTFARWKQEADALNLEDSSSTSSSEEDDDLDAFLSGPSGLPAPRNKATQHPKTNTDASPISLAGSKQPSVLSESNELSDHSKSAIWRYLMTLTKTEIPVPDDRAVVELLALPKRRDLPRTWQRRLSKFEEFQLHTLTGLILYLGGVEESSGVEGSSAVQISSGVEGSSNPCDNCRVHSEAHLFRKMNFYHGSYVDHWYPFPKCVFLPNNLHDSASISERLGHRSCCNEYYRRRWMKVPHWMNAVPNGSGSLEVAQEAAGMDVMKTTSTNKPDGTQLSANMPSNRLNNATSTTKAGNNAVQPLSWQASLPARSPLQPAAMVRDTTTSRSSAQQAASQSAVKGRTGNKSGLESSPVNPNVGANNWLQGVRNKRKEKKTERKTAHQEEGLGVEERRSSTRQAQVTPVSSAAVSLSSLTVQDTPMAPSTSKQQGVPGNSQEGAIFDPANKSAQFIGFPGEKAQLLQASRRYTLECIVMAGSMKVNMIKTGGMDTTRRVNGGESWTIEPDSQCLVSNFFPVDRETAVLKIKSQPVLASME